MFDENKIKSSKRNKENYQKSGKMILRESCLEQGDRLLLIMLMLLLKVALS